MRAVALFGVFLAAKLASLAGRDLPVSLWLPLACIWQDLLAACVFALLDRALARPRAAWLVYGAASGWAVLNVAVVQALSSPLTVTMLRAARWELGDSMRHYLTFRDLSGPLLVGAAAALLPILLRGRSWRPGHAAMAAVCVMIAAGPFAAGRVETRGLERNALVALASSSLPRVAAHAAEEPWRSSPFSSAAPEDLERLRGKASGRDILVVMLESTAARYVGLYGGEPDPTPNLTALAARGLVFENAYCVYPESIKGLFSLLCSRYPAFDTPAEAYRGSPDHAIAQVLRDAGYHTGLFHSGRFMYLGMDAVLEGRGFDRLEDAGDIGGERNSSFGIDESSTVRRILAWIDGLGGGPFFALYLPIAGHHPYASADAGPFPGDSDFDRYRSALFEGDRALGELLEGLRRRGRDRSTLVIAAGDHGEGFGQHGGNYGHTLAIHEENVRVPLVAALPGVIEAPLRIGRVASLVDLAPTILDLVGLGIPASFDGASLLGGPPRMALFFTDYSLGYLGLRDGCTKFVYEIEARRSHLFDLCRDPDESTDLAPSLPRRADFYRARLERWSSAEKARLGLEGRELADGFTARAR